MNGISFFIQRECRKPINIQLTQSIDFSANDNYWNWIKTGNSINKPYDLTRHKSYNRFKGERKSI